MNPLAFQVLIVVSSVPESWLEPSLPRWTRFGDKEPPLDARPSEKLFRPAADPEPTRSEP